MCGIAGFVDFNKKSNRTMLKKMTDVLHHRGPDDSGYTFIEHQYANIGLGHRRLSILDLSRHGHQPMSFDSLEIVYNGEVYNFQEIREELKSFNYTFESDSDTEVILKAYHKWGIKAVDKFNGMFAIVFFDKKAHKLLLIRDRAGVKPCYYYHNKNLLMYASELKSLHKNSAFVKQINNDALGLYLQYGYIPQPHSIFEHTYKLRAGHYLEVDVKTQSVAEKKYWDVIDVYNKPKFEISDNEAIAETEKLFKSAFAYRMVSDVPVGIFLSGGYDSAMVTAMLQSQNRKKLNTFTIGFHEQAFDEAPYARRIAEYLGTHHTEYYCTPEDALDIIPRLCEIYDEPFGDSSAIPTALVSLLARKDVKVSLSADGGDEIFAGYMKYDATLNYLSRFSKISHRLKPLLHFAMDQINPSFIPLLNKTYNFETKYLKTKALLNATDAIETMQYVSQYYTDKQVNELLNKNIKTISTSFADDVLDHNDPINKMLAIDYKTYLVDDILTKVDRATMSSGLEGREPLLDHRIIEFAARLPSPFKYRDGQKKWLLKQITHQYLPEKMMDRPKKGFGVPITSWFRDELKEYFMSYLNTQRLDKEGIFNTPEVIKLRDRYLQGHKENVKKLWFILMFEMWYEKWMV